MLFDLHNIVPAIGQVIQYRRNDRYAVVADDADHDTWLGCDVKDTGGTSSDDVNRFEPADCTKGDVARVWLYMHDQYGVVIPDDERKMFVEWDRADPVSAWELERDNRIAGIQGNHNPYVQGFEADAAGACTWEPLEDGGE